MLSEKDILIINTIIEDEGNCDRAPSCSACPLRELGTTQCIIPYVKDNRDERDNKRWQERKLALAKTILRCVQEEK